MQRTFFDSAGDIIWYLRRSKSLTNHGMHADQDIRDRTPIEELSQRIRFELAASCAASLRVLMQVKFRYSVLK